MEIDVVTWPADRSVMVVRGWDGPGAPIDRAVGPIVDTDSAMFRLALAPVLGPTATLLAQMLATAARAGEREWHAADLSGALGVETWRLRRTVERLARFGWAVRLDDSTIGIRVRGSVTARQIDRLPPFLQHVYLDELTPSAGSSTS